MTVERRLRKQQRDAEVGAWHQERLTGAVFSAMKAMLGMQRSLRLKGLAVEL